MDIQIRADVIMQPQDYLALTRFMTYKKNRNGLALNIMLVGIIALAIYSDLKISGKPTIITLVAAAAALGTFLIPEVSARKFIKQDTSFLGHEFRYVLDENGVNLLDVENETTALHPWAAFLNAYETKDHFFLFLTKQNALLIPKRSMTAEDLADFCELLRYQLDKRYEVR